MLALEHIVDATGCDARALADLATMRALCDGVVRAAGVVVVGTPQWHKFAAPAGAPPESGGVTGVYLLSESHLAVHTWPERAALALSFCCCRPGIALDWRAVLGESVRATRVDVRVLERGP